ncbi:MAG: alanyl-tRNA editing protein [Wenzhouxiangellaceae bacterium]|nr:alanyl-tRNA editing protein [Wenzhouxiangellaceae bacterium]
MAELLFKSDAYLTHCNARVLEAEPEGIVLDQTVFYATGGGQPGDIGRLRFSDGAVEIIATRYRREDGEILHIPAEGAALPQPGTNVEAHIDWDLRHCHMRMHTCLHLLGAVLKYPVTGGQIGADKSRLDFDMPEPPERDEVERALNALIEADHPVTSRWIDEAELDPALIRTMSVKPPSGVGRIRLLDIPGVDLQPCGGTHVKSTAEIGPVEIVKIEKKGRQNRRVQVALR